MDVNESVSNSSKYRTKYTPLNRLHPSLKKKKCSHCVVGNVEQESLLMISPPASDERRTFGKPATPNGKYSGQYIVLHFKIKKLS